MRNLWSNLIIHKIWKSFFQIEVFCLTERNYENHETFLSNLWWKWRHTFKLHPLCFFSRIFIKNDLEGFITKQKILKSHGFMQVRDAWAASEQGKQNSKTGIGWLGPYLKNKIGNFHSKYALCYSESSRVLLFAKSFNLLERFFSWILLLRLSS